MKVLTHPGLPLRANERAVALVMFSYADMETLLCYPSIDEISRRAKVGRETVCRTTKKLQDLGLVKVTKKHRTGGEYACNEYDFNPLRMHI